MVRAPTPEEEELARRLVDEALEGFDAVLEPAALEIMRALFESELVATTEGQRLLRACAPDPVVQESDDLASWGKPQAITPPAKKGTGRG